ncbi:MAG: thermonuclease family protein [Candidatus Peribacteraceae bacterium]|nr:thermonuclease family protein [Candidatus Peribacteraceae bacterium]
MKKIGLGIILLFVTTISYGTIYDVEVIKVIDGDTIKVSVDVWPKWKTEVNVRLNGVNAPESQRPITPIGYSNLISQELKQCEKNAGIKAKNFVFDFLKDKDIKLSNVRLGKFAGRVLGKILADGNDLSVILIRAGHARNYDGGKRGPWCLVE